MLFKISIKVVIIFNIFHTTVDRHFWILKKIYIVTKKIMNQVRQNELLFVVLPYTKMSNLRKFSLKKGQKIIFIFS